MGRDHAGRQALAQYLVIEVGMHVGDDGTLRLEALDPAKRVADAEMAGMAGIAQPVDDPEVEVLQRRPAFRRDIVEVGRIGGGPDTEAERRDIAVMNEEGGKLYR